MICSRISKSDLDTIFDHENFKCYNVTEQTAKDLDVPALLPQVG
jgi:hypothetical protein